ncbi:TIGR03013 family PEP-CTERM/XrtA system glycosyltransferase [bacterium]|nr:TIGR03013 family PEP-CTERM/XrtA system glycosyltransferase [bacterium]
MLRLLQQYYPIRNMFFIAGEGLAIFLSVTLSFIIIYGFSINVFGGQQILKTILMAVIIQGCLYFNDLYDLQVSDTLKEIGIRLFQALGISAFILSFIYMIIPSLVLGEGIFAVGIIFIIIFIIAWRFFYMMVLSRGLFNQKIILLGADALANEIEKEINSKQDSGYTISLKVYDDNTQNGMTEQARNKDTIQKKGFDGICKIAKELEIKKIVVAFKEKRGTFPAKELLKCRVDGIEVVDGNSFYEMLTGKLDVTQINPSWLIFSDGFRKSFFRRIVKRAEDILFSFILLIATSPIFLLTSILIMVDSRGSLFFSQERVGQNRRIYKAHKFRSMIQEAEKYTGPVWAEDNDQRITRVGAWIRKFRIDEIPQLWNVFKGEMSFVGPRPERDFFVKQLEINIPYYGERFTVKPGITGWAQVSYGYGATEDDALEKLNYDLFYIKNMSTIMDFVIVIRTIKTVLFGKGR